MRTSFRQILPQTALKILAGRKPACGFLPTLQQNYARKSAHISYEDRFLFFHSEGLFRHNYHQDKENRDVKGHQPYGDVIGNKSENRGHKC